MLPDAEGAPTLQNEISNTMVSRYVKLIEEYCELEGKLDGILNDPLVKKLDPFKKTLRLFQQCLASLFDEVKVRVRELIINIRSGSAEALSFNQFLNRTENENFPVNVNRLDQWLKGKHKELCMIKRFKDQLTSKERTLFFPPEEKLQEQMTKSIVRYALHFVFTSLARPDPFLEHWRNIAFDVEHTKSQVPLIDDSNHARWYRDPSSIKKIEEEISNFTEFVKTYKKDKRFVFAVTAASDHKEGSISGSTIYVYNRGSLRKATDQNSNSGIKTTEMFASTMANVMKDVAFDAFEKEMIERTFNNIRNEKWLSDGKIMHKHIDLHLAQLFTDGDIDGTLKRIGQPQLHLTKVLHQLISRKIPNIDREWRNFVYHLKNAIKAAARVSAVLDIDRAQRFVDKLRDEFSKIFHSDFLENSFRMNCSETYEDCDNANKNTFQEECVRELTKILESLQFKTTNQQEFDSLFAPKVIEFVKFLNEPTCIPRCDAYCPMCKSFLLMELTRRLS